MTQSPQNSEEEGEIMHATTQTEIKWCKHCAGPGYKYGVVDRFRRERAIVHPRNGYTHVLWPGTRETMCQKDTTYWYAPDESLPPHKAEGRLIDTGETVYFDANMRQWRGPNYFVSRARVLYPVPDEDSEQP